MIFQYNSKLFRIIPFQFIFNQNYTKLKHIKHAPNQNAFSLSLKPFKNLYKNPSYPLNFVKLQKNHSMRLRIQNVLYQKFSRINLMT